MYKFSYYDFLSKVLNELEFDSKEQYDTFIVQQNNNGTEIVLGELLSIKEKKIVEIYTDFYYLVTLKITDISADQIFSEKTETIPHAGSLTSILTSKQSNTTKVVILFAQRISKLEFILLSNK